MYVDYTSIGVPDDNDANWTKDAPNYVKDDIDNFTVEALITLLLFLIALISLLKNITG